MSDDTSDRSVSAVPQSGELYAFLIETYLYCNPLCSFFFPELIKQNSKIAVAENSNAFPISISLPELNSSGKEIH